MTRRSPFAIACLAVAAVSLVATGAAAQKNFDQPPQMGNAPSRSAGNPRFTLINDSTQIIDNLNISAVSDDSWGDDLLGNLAIPPHNRVIAGPPNETGCTYDVRVVYHDRREEVMRRQNLCDLRELSFTGRNARRPANKSDN